MNSIKKLLPVILIILMVLSNIQLVKGEIEYQSNEKAILKKAESCIEQELYGKAESYYDELVQLTGKEKYYNACIDMYASCKEYDKQVTWAEKYKNSCDESAKAYEQLIAAYYAVEDYEDIFPVFKEAKSREITSENLEKLWEEYEFLYKENGLNVNEIAPVYSGNYSWASNGDKFCIIGPNGKRVTTYEYDSVGYNANNIIPIKKNGKWFLLNLETYLEANLTFNFDFKVESVGLYNEDMFSVSDGKKYYFSDLSYELLYGPYEYAGSFNSGVAPVKKDGKWSIINKEGKVVAGPYSDIVVDDRGVCSTGGRCFVKKDGKYIMISLDGKRVGDASFDEAKLFLSADGYAAVRNGKTWSFVDVDGKFLDIKEKYQDANSFSCGLSAVKVKGKYGYITTKGEWAIKPEYEQARPFNKSGYAMVYEMDSWSRILLYQYK